LPDKRLIDKVCLQTDNPHALSTVVSADGFAEGLGAGWSFFSVLEDKPSSYQMKV
jgi:hypothetical protein